LGLNRLNAFLRRHRRIALDTNVFIYQLEYNARYRPFTNPVFSWLDLPDCQAVTSTVTMTELLVQPLREGDKLRVDLYYGLFSRHPTLHWVAPDLDVARLAAEYRATHGLKTIDALHAATAILASATGLITNDAALARVGGIDVLVLETLLAT
jgi:predicted nucleic acid-binding protein